jgi:uncharacterized protein YutE (UPF0331/DUF86 family)
MADDVLINKAASIERCVMRAREEYTASAGAFATNYSRQDAAILNIQRACEASLDIAHHIIRRDRLGVPQSARDTFDMLAAARMIPTELADALKKMVAFRNIAVHDDQSLLLPITENIIQHHLDDFLDFTRAVLTQGSKPEMDGVA